MSGWNTLKELDVQGVPGPGLASDDLFDLADSLHVR